MTHHKRGKPKNARSGCLLCKSWKMNHAPIPYRSKPSDLRREIGAEYDVVDALPTAQQLNYEQSEYIEVRYGGPELYEESVIDWYLSFNEGDK